MAELAATGKRYSLHEEALRSGLFALAYFVGGEFGYALSLGPSVGGTFWPPAGVSLAFFLASPRRSWPLLLVAGVVANYVSDLLHGQTLPASIGFALANLSEPLLGAVLLQRALGAVKFTRMVDVAALALTVVLVSAPVAAAIGALTAQRFTLNPPGFVDGWLTWWVGDSVGAIVLAPAVFRLITGWRRAAVQPARLWLEAGAFLLVLVAVTELVFAAPPGSLAMPFLVFPVLLWGSLRLGPVGIGAGLCLVVLMTTHDTVAGSGPFGSATLLPGQQLVALQIYVGVMALSFHGMALLWEERSRTAALLKSAHSGLEARYRRIVEQSPLAILALAPGGAVQEVNPAWRALWAAPRAQEAGGKPWEDPLLRPLLDKAFAGEVVELPERELAPAADGDAPRRVRGFAYPVKDELGNVGEVVLIERDITDEVLAERQREQLLEAERFARGEAERASQLKDEFLATLSHELRTPLNAIVGWTHILRRTATDPALSQAVDTIERNALAQAKLIDDLLDMSRIMAGKVGLTFTRFELGTIVAAAINALRPVADSKGVSLTMAAEAPSADWLVGDAARIQQVVANLLSNGVKFTPAGGRVDVRIAAEEQGVRLVVQDTGRGIPREFLPNVFERFRQADGSITRRHGGLGLGLSIAKQIVELHGGTISADSAGPDRGATFTVTFPRPPEGAVEVAAGDVPHPLDLRNVSALVVDDEADARELLRRLLGDYGCDVAAVASADEALKALAARHYDLLLTDIGMPGMDGYELLRRMRENTAARPTAIAVTAFARAEDRDRALAAGFAGHLAKPVAPARLLKLLGRLVATR